MKESYKSLVTALVNISTPFANSIEKFQGAGGNTSVKESNGLMAIKASGFRLDELSEDNGFAIVHYPLLKDKVQHCINFSKKEELSIRQLTKENTRFDISDFRPSMETAFHVLFDKYVIHTHSSIANILNCSIEGANLLATAYKTSPYSFLCIPYITPGIELGICIQQHLKKHLQKHPSLPDFVFLKNHGIIVHSANEQEVVDKINWLDNTLTELLKIKNIFPSAVLKEITENEFEVESLSFSNTTENFVLQLYTKVLTPDQSIFINDLSLFTNTVPKGNRKVISKNNKLIIRANKREAQSILENILTYKFILTNLERLSLAPSFLSVESILALHNLESEKYRKQLQANTFTK